MARTAVIAGTATAVSNNVSRRQQARWAAQDQPTGDVMAEEDLTAQLDQLMRMKESGQLTAGEFAAAKAKLLGT
jgi:hypothetical protein